MEPNISKPKMSRKKKAFIIIGSIIGALLLGIFILYRVVVGKIYDDSVPIVERPKEEVTEEKADDVEEDIPIYSQVPVEEDVINILVMGSDSRDPDKDRGRSDTMLLLSYNRKEKKATLVSFLRDGLVSIEGHGQSRLNHSYSWGGVGLTINTINDNFGLDIQNYVTLNFDNMENIVNDLGGITVPITAAEVEYYQKNFDITFKEGDNTLNGEQALIHARNRYLDSDFGRTRRQRDIMVAVYKKAMEDKSIKSITTLVSAGLNQVKTNIPPNEVYTLAMEIINLDDLEIQQAAVPAEGTWSNQRYKGMAILQMDIEENKKILHDYFY